MGVNNIQAKHCTDVNRSLSQVGLGREIVDAPLAGGRVERAEYRGEVFHVRSLVGWDR